MRECEQFEWLLHAQLDDMITDEEQRRLLDHLAGCEHCRALQQDLLELSDAMSEMHAVAPPELTSNIMAAVQQEQLRAMAPLKRRKRMRALIGSAAACLAVVLVATAVLRGGSNLGAQDSTLEAAPFHEQNIEAEAADSTGTDESDTLLIEGTGEDIPNYESSSEAADDNGSSLLDGLGEVGGVQSSGAENSSESTPESAAPSVKSAPRTTQPSEAESTIVDGSTTDSNSATTDSNSATSDSSSVQTETPSITDDVPPATSFSDGTEIAPASEAETEMFTARTTSSGIGYAKELYFTAIDSVPSFLLELGVPDITGGASSYELIVSLEECNAVELQFIANGLDYTVAPHNEESVGSEQGRVIITYERTERQSASSDEEDVFPLS